MGGIVWSSKKEDKVRGKYGPYPQGVYSLGSDKMDQYKHYEITISSQYTIDQSPRAIVLTIE